MDPAREGTKTRILFGIKFQIPGMNCQKCNSIFKNQAFIYAIEEHTKGQLILECPFGVFKSPKKTMKFFPGFLP